MGVGGCKEEECEGEEEGWGMKGCKEEGSEEEEEG